VTNPIHRSDLSLQPKGKTLVLTAEEAGELLRSIETDTVLGLRDRALIGVMVFTFARISAACCLNVGDSSTNSAGQAPIGSQMDVEVLSCGRGRDRYPRIDLSVTGLAKQVQATRDQITPATQGSPKVLDLHAGVVSHRTLPKPYLTLRSGRN